MTVASPLTWENGGAARSATTGRLLTTSLDPTEEGLAVEATRTCDVTNCDRKHYGQGLCRRHYDNARYAGLLPPVERPSLTERFFAKVDVGLADECWLWTGRLNNNGYGSLWSADKQGSVYAHRLSYEIHYGPIPAGQYVCHRCDNPKCVNPDHLFLGTQADNMADMVRKGRHGKPVVRPKPRARLSPQQVHEIRAAVALGTDRGAVAALHGVTRGTINDVVAGRSWADT